MIVSRSFLKVAGFTFMATIFMSCLSSKDFIVESDYSYSGKFKNYKSYSFFTTQNSGIEEHVIDDILKNTIKYRMSLLGYQEVDKKPDMLIAYKLFFNNFDFNGFMQPELEDWLKYENYCEDHIANQRKYNLQKGTLFIQFIDVKQQKTVWQGYNSGLINTRSLDNGRYVNYTVRTILEKFRIFARGHLEES